MYEDSLDGVAADVELLLLSTEFVLVARADALMERMPLPDLVRVRTEEKLAVSDRVRLAREEVLALAHAVEEKGTKVAPEDLLARTVTEVLCDLLAVAH